MASTLLEEAERAPDSNCVRILVLGSSRVGKTALVRRFVVSPYVSHRVPRTAGGSSYSPDTHRQTFISGHSPIGPSLSTTSSCNTHEGGSEGCNGGGGGQEEENAWDDSYTPTIEDFHRKVYRVRNEYFKVDLLDTAGTDPFPAMRRLNILAGDLFMVVYSVDSRESFEEALRLRDEVVNTIFGQHSAGGAPKWKHCRMIPLVLVANKCDLPAQRHMVPAMEARRAALETNIQHKLGAGASFVEASAKENWGVSDLFDSLFATAGLPQELAPGRHRLVHYSFALGSHGSLHISNSLSTNEGDVEARPRTNRLPSVSSVSHGIGRQLTHHISRRWRSIPDAIGAVVPTALRPSIQQDMLALQSGAKINRRPHQHHHQQQNQEKRNKSAGSTREKNNHLPLHTTATNASDNGSVSNENAKAALGCTGHPVDRCIIM